MAGTLSARSGPLNLREGQVRLRRTPTTVEPPIDFLQVESFRDTFVVAAAVCFATLLPVLALGRGRRSVA